MNQILDVGSTILEFIIAIGFLAFVHELGHYLAARLFNIEVEEFGFGFPPRMTRLFHRWGTDFTLNWIPFGAFVRPKGENDPSVPGGLAAAKPFARLAVLLAGPFMNLLTGAVIMSILFFNDGIPAEIYDVEISAVSGNSPAEMAGLLPGDIISAINEQEIENVDALIAVVDANSGKEIAIAYQRAGETFTTIATPRIDPPEGQKGLGIGLAPAPFVPVPIEKAPMYAIQETVNQGRQLLMLPVMLVREQISKEDARVSGFVGMFRFYSGVRSLDKEASAASADKAPSVMTLWLIAYISISFGYVNLLPLPALDGGRILFIVPEVALNRRIPADYENMVHALGFFALIALMFYITVMDIINPVPLPW